MERRHFMQGQHKEKAENILKILASDYLQKLHMLSKIALLHGTIENALKTPPTHTFPFKIAIFAK